MRVLTVLLLIGVLTACGSSQTTSTPTPETIASPESAALQAAAESTSVSASAGDPAAAETVQQYMTAKAEADEDTIRALLCSEMEADLEREINSFAAVDARIEEVACVAESESVVRCTGAIVVTYGTEDTSFPLGAYRVVQEDGEWRWCGEAQ
ncbi:MAG: hypothetical protein HC828_08115 [Blastochloris sp.]|nr:hypothetical protein [Blastochloris sp.]